MQLDLDPKQREQLELIALHAGKPPAQVLLETAHFLLENDLKFWESVQRGFPPSGTQHFLEPEELDQRIARLLHR